MLKTFQTKFKQKCKHCLKYKEKCKECKDDPEWCKNIKNLTNQIPVKIIVKMQNVHEDCNRYVEYKKVMKNTNFMFKCLKCCERLLSIADYVILKFPATFEYSKKYLEKFILSLRKCVIYCKYIDSWDNYNETSLPPKEKFFRKLKIKGITDGDKEYTVHITRNI